MVMVSTALQWPNKVDFNTVAYQGSRYLGILSTTKKKIAIHVNPDHDMTLSSISLYFDVITTSEDMRITIEQPTTGGTPSGTPITNGDSDTLSATTIDSVGANAWHEFIFTSEPTLSQGLWYYIIVEWVSTEGDTRIVAASSHNLTAQHYWTGSSWLALDYSGGGLGIFKNSSGVVQRVPDWRSSLASTNPTYSTTGTNREIGIRFQVPFDCTVNGLLWCGDWTSSTNNPSIVFYTDGETAGSGGTVVATVGDIGSAEDDFNMGNGGACEWRVGFKTDVSITRDTWYKIMLRPPSSTNQIIWTSPMFDGGARSLIGATGEYQYQRANSGGFLTAETDIWPLMQLLIREVSLGGSGSRRSSPIKIMVPV